MAEVQNNSGTLKGSGVHSGSGAPDFTPFQGLRFRRGISKLIARNNYAHLKLCVIVSCSESRSGRALGATNNYSHLKV